MATPAADEEFTKLAADLIALRPDLPEQVLCPLCLQPFVRADLDPPEGDAKSEPKLSPEHVPPQAIGGKPVTLTCRKCNNRDGAKLDKELVQMIRSLNSIEGDGSRLPATGDFGGHELPLLIRWSIDEHGKRSCDMRIPGAKPVVQETIISQLASGQVKEFKLQINLKYKPNEQQLALLRMAYLALFTQLGYAYILSESANVIRKAIKGEELPGVGLENLISPIKVEVKADLPGAIVSPVVTENGFHIAYFIVLRIQQRADRYFGVLMPTAYTPPDSLWDHLILASRALVGPQVISVVK